MNVYVGTNTMKNAYIGEYSEEYATRGPCASGFHVPLESELTGLFNAGISLGAWNAGSTAYTGMGTYLYLPISGYRETSSSKTSWMGIYWSSTFSSSYGRGLAIQYSSAGITGWSTAHGGSIRPFKNKPVVPDSSWTRTYTGTGTAGIYHNTSKGLVSISSDGSTWYTISDKNLGATTLYDLSASLDETNCGKYYQWGNNYGFAWSGALTTSTSQVNASTYGPSNYYNNSTFRKRTSSPYNWDSSNNANLWGGETGNVPVS